MIKTRIFASFGAVALAAALAGCQGMSPMPQMASRQMAPAPQVMQGSVEGEWASADGVAISRFSNGGFETVATDTGNRLAEGSYTYRDQNNVEIAMTSLIRQTTARVNCSVATPTQLNCTGESGNQFTLVRRQGVS